MSVAVQTALFGSGETTLDPYLTGLRRRDLGEEAWVDHLPGWLEGHEALFDDLVSSIAWRSEKRPMYDRIVDVPRLLANVPDDGPIPPIVERAKHALSAYYGIFFERIHMAYYRDGRDSVAMHADHVTHDTIVPILSVGTPRRFTMRRNAGGDTRHLMLGWGDLLVMGGTFQSTWQHGVPKVATAEPRISIIFRTAASY